ncbi:MAG: B12-binding domain-containing radical SAM protein [Deltaproteobacteria bacterium]|nr:B12-binding domain-containing radical SAM protein [Deltaproteobacteria bacterium]
MKVLLVVPGWSPSNLWGQIQFKFPPLSLLTLVAASPEDVEVSIIDENIEKIDFENTADLVGITVMTPQAPRAYQIADEFRKRGKQVALGGFHVSHLPAEALNHADTVIIGEGDRVWKEVIKDYQESKLKKIYKDDELVSLSEIKTPQRDLIKGKDYLFTNTIQTTRGCPFDCEFCSVSSFFGRIYRTRPIPIVMEELRKLRQKNVFLFLVDDNLVGNRSYAKTLFQEMASLKFKWASHAPLDFANDEELLKLASQSGCMALFVGFESLSRDNLSMMRKKTSIGISPIEAVRKFHDQGIGILASFILGYDHDTPDTFEKILEFCHQGKIDGGLFPILTPYPGTRLRKRLKNEGRLLTDQWDLYDMEHVTFLPKRMSPEKLREGFNWLNSSFLSRTSIFRRLFKIHRSLQIFGPMNFGFRKAWKKKTT